MALLAIGGAIDASEDCLGSSSATAKNDEKFLSGNN